MVDWGANATSLGLTLVVVFLWVAVWNLVELCVEVVIDGHRNARRSKFIVYGLMFVAACLLVLTLGTGVH